jgi:hypothetical protein
MQFSIQFVNMILDSCAAAQINKDKIRNIQAHILFQARILWVGVAPIDFGA